MTKSKLYNTMYYDSKAFKKRMTFSHVLITPNLAKELLELNTHNRGLKNYKELGDKMTAGEWIDNGDSIRISIEGVLLDGQNRLMAIIYSGVSVYQDIVTGLQPEAFQTMDIGKTRSKGDTVAVMGFKNQNYVAGLATYLISYDITKNFHVAGSFRGSDNQDIARYLKAMNEKQMEHFMQSINDGMSYYKTGKMFFAPPAWAFLDILLSRKNSTQAKEFLHKLSTGDEISSSDGTSAIFLCRNRILALVGMARVQVDLKYKFALCIIAWNSYRKNKVIKKLSWDAQQDYPVPI